jgi:hypothetical protein
MNIIYEQQNTLIIKNYKFCTTKQKTMGQQAALRFFLIGLIELEIGKGIPTSKQEELHSLYDKAKKMEKAEIIESRENGIIECGRRMNNSYYGNWIESEKYYKETYGK